LAMSKRFIGLGDGRSMVQKCVFKIFRGRRTLNTTKT